MDMNMIQQTLDRYINQNSEVVQGWSFLRHFTIHETHEITHGIHPYPAKMVPQIAREIIRRFTKEKALVLDPFCGSGTVLLEALIAGRNGIGIDTNPLACLIARAKTTVLDNSEIKKFQR